MNYSTIFAFLLVASMSSADQVREIWVQTSNCADCGMTSLGQLSAKICGQGLPTQNGGSCCVAVHMDNNQNNFQEGALDVFAGPSSLGECYNFELGTLVADEDISMVIYHDGTDGARFDYVRLFTVAGSFYECTFGQFMDGTSFNAGANCHKV